MVVPKAFLRHFSVPRIHGFASGTPSSESEEEGGDAEGDSALALAPQVNDIPTANDIPEADGRAADLGAAAC